MKSGPQSLIDFSLSTDVQSCYIADLFTVTLTSGLVLYITDGQLPVTYQGNVYESTRWGSWKCTGTMAGLGIMNASASLQVYAYTDIILPGFAIPLMQAIGLGLFDAAQIRILTTEGLSYGNTDFGTFVRFQGVIAELNETGRISAQGTCKPDAFSLNQNMPRNVVQPGCGWVFGDAGCTIDLATVTATNSVGAGSSSRFILAQSPLGHGDDYYTQGILRFTSGQNAGLSVWIERQTGNTIQLVRPPLLPIKTGDSFSITAGCDHTMSTCQLKYNNLIHYGGEPYVPNAETSI